MRRILPSIALVIICSASGVMAELPPKKPNIVPEKVAVASFAQVNPSEILEKNACAHHAHPESQCKTVLYGNVVNGGAVEFDGSGRNMFGGTPATNAISQVFEANHFTVYRSEDTYTINQLYTQQEVDKLLEDQQNAIISAYNLALERRLIEALAITQTSLDDLQGQIDELRSELEAED